MIKLDDIKKYEGLPLFNWAIDQQAKFYLAVTQNYCYCTELGVSMGVVCWKCQRDFETDMKEGNDV